MHINVEMMCTDEDNVVIVKTDRIKYRRVVQTYERQYFESFLFTPPAGRIHFKFYATGIFTRVYTEIMLQDK